MPLIRKIKPRWQFAPTQAVTPNYAHHFTRGLKFAAVATSPERDIVGGAALTYLGVAKVDRGPLGLGFYTGLNGIQTGQATPPDAISFTSPVTSGDVTILAWFTGTNAATQGTPIGVASAGGGDFIILTSNYSYLGETMFNGLAGDQRSISWQIGNTSILTGNPHLLTYTNRSGVSNAAKVYMNRAQHGSGGTHTTTITNPLYLLASGNSGISEAYRFPGHLYQALIFDRSLSQEEVVEFYEAPWAWTKPHVQRSIYLVSAALAPEIEVTGNGQIIADGDATPSATDHTDFGTTTQGGATISRTFTVANTGNATLTISGVTVPTGFTVTTALPGTIAAAGSAPLIVRLDTATAGTKSGNITITSDDIDEGTFDFAATGTVTPAPGGAVRTGRTDIIRGTVFGMVQQ